MRTVVRGTVIHVVAAVGVCALIAAAPAQRKKKEEITQTLQLPKELPAAVAGETRRLTFHTTPLSSKGLLSAQVRDALKALGHEAGGGTVLHIRAFVAGSGDLRRVRDLVSEHFGDHKQPLPALSLVRAGGLPLEGAQVVLEATAVGKKDVNPNGLVFVPGAAATSDRPLDPVPPLAARSLEQLRQALKDAGSDATDVLRVTCMVSSLDQIAEVRKLVEAEYPRASLDYVQTQRAAVQALAACEAVARLHSGIAKRVQWVGPEDAPRAAMVAAPHVVLTGTQVSYGYQDADSRLAFERLVKTLEGMGVSGRDAVYARYYPLAEPIAAQVRKLRAGFLGSPASSMITVEGLASMDAGFAADVVAAKD
jgi:enamine deaminase RidA (YjgF/YER057c/UK114 family)